MESHFLSGSEGEIDSLHRLKEKGGIAGEIIWRKCDVTSERSVGEAVQSTLADGQNVDVLINNAGIAIGAPHTFWDQPFTDIHTMIATTFLAWSMLRTLCSTVSSYSQGREPF